MAADAPTTEMMMVRASTMNRLLSAPEISEFNIAGSLLFWFCREDQLALEHEGPAGHDTLTLCQTLPDDHHVLVVGRWLIHDHRLKVKRLTILLGHKNTWFAIPFHNS